MSVLDYRACAAVCETLPRMAGVHEIDGGNEARRMREANARSEARQRDMEMVANDSLKQRELVPDARAVPTYWIPVEERERAPPQPGDGARARWRRGPALWPAQNERTNVSANPIYRPAHGDLKRRSRSLHLSACALWI